MARDTDPSAVLTIRVPTKLARQLAREARRRRQSRSALARTILEERLGDREAPDMASEARRQSLLVSRRRSEREMLTFVADAADLRGWT